MTVPYKPARRVVVNTGAVSTIFIDFPVEKASDVDVYVGLPGAFQLSLGTDYTVDGIGGTSAAVNINNPAAWGDYEVFAVYVEYVVDQSSDVDSGGTLGRRFEDALDRQTRVLQSFSDKVNRSIKLPITTPVDQDNTLVPVPGEILGWDVNGEQLTTYPSVTQSIQDAIDAADRAEAAADEIDAALPAALRTYATEVAFQMATIPAPLTYIDTAGYYAPGDGGGHRKVRIATPAPVKPWHKQSADGAWWQVHEKEINPRAFGAVGDVATNDTAAFDATLDYQAALNVPIVLDNINIGYHGSRDLPRNFNIKGVGGSDLCTWFDNADKLNVRNGYKHLVSGSNIWLKGAATLTYATDRPDGWATVSYGFAYRFKEAFRWDGVGLIQDMNIFTAGGVKTTAAQTNAAAFDVGLVAFGYQHEILNSNFFGYWGAGKASFLLHSLQAYENLDSDYFRAFNSNFTSVAILGDTDEVDNGITGGTWLMCGMYSGADHHDSAAGDYTKPAITIDGDNGVFGLRGHKWLGGNLRTRNNTIISLDRCDNVAFEFSATETPALTTLVGGVPTGVPGADTQGKIVGTSRTNNVRVTNVAISATASWGLNELAAAINGSLVAIGGQSGDELVVSRKGRGVRVTTNGADDSVIQLTADFTSETSDWTILRDDDKADKLSFRYDNSEVFSVTAGGGVSSRETVSVANDAVVTVPAPSNGGFAKVLCAGSNGNAPNVNASGEVIFDVVAGFNIVKASGGANFAAVNTDVTGATGVAGNVTVGIVAGALKVENRTGGPQLFKVAFFNS